MTRELREQVINALKNIVNEELVDNRDHVYFTEADKEKICTKLSKELCNDIELDEDFSNKYDLHYHYLKHVLQEDGNPTIVAEEYYTSNGKNITDVTFYKYMRQYEYNNAANNIVSCDPSFEVDLDSDVDVNDVLADWSTFLNCSNDYFKITSSKITDSNGNPNDVIIHAYSTLDTNGVGKQLDICYVSKYSGYPESLYPCGVSSAYNRFISPFVMKNI